MRHRGFDLALVHFLITFDQLISAVPGEIEWRNIAVRLVLVHQQERLANASGWNESSNVPITINMFFTLPSDEDPMFNRALPLSRNRAHSA
jgi:hypothetical protein